LPASGGSFGPVNVDPYALLFVDEGGGGAELYPGGTGADGIGERGGATVEDVDIVICRSVWVEGGEGGFHGVGVWPPGRGTFDGDAPGGGGGKNRGALGSG